MSGDSGSPFHLAVAHSNPANLGAPAQAKGLRAVDRTYLCGIIASLGTYIFGAALFNNLNNR
jgi:hypothetical protein